MTYEEYRNRCKVLVTINGDSFEWFATGLCYGTFYLLIDIGIHAHDAALACAIQTYAPSHPWAEGKGD